MEGQLNDLEKKLSEMLQNVTAPNIDEIDKQCIYRVPSNIRKSTPKAYTPQIVSIGPYHRNSNKATERLKLKYVKAFLNRRKLSEKILVAKIKEICENINIIRSCYAETIEGNDVDFLTMIFVDALFIIELFLRWSDPHVWEGKDHIMLKPWMRLEIKHDLMILENQLPFSVLEQLYNLTNESLPITNEPLSSTTNESFRDTNESLRDTPSFFKMCVNCIRTGTTCFNCIRTKEPLTGTNEPLTGTNKPILSFCQICFNCLKSTSFETECPEESPKHFTDLLRSSIISSSKIDHGNQTESKEDIKHVYSASQLMEAGLEFKVSPNKSFLDLELSEDGVLSMPSLNINASTYLYLRNMVAYESCHHSATKIITQYVAILYFLIKTEKDVNVLVDKKIIVNWSGDANKVVTVINNLASSMSMPDFTPYYCSICTGLNNFYENPLNKYKAIFVHDYFNTPWKKASTIAAIVLLLLTFVQTVCSIISVV
ncbi:hypothetical protein V8G54_013037 [Vigna mungo]|uniref:Uncharacterized protein n=1 Tax=Vigna mungo TaxID=3915 RepID=A0AAQ3NUW9_VIGMU